MRRSEILRLRWLDLDLAGGRALLPQTKNGDGRIVYLNNLAIQEIKSIQVTPDKKPIDRLFPGLEPEWVSVAFSRVCSSVKIADFHFHDLRHTAASWMRMKGADIHTVALLLGHKDLRMALATSISPRRQPVCSPLPDLIGVCWARCPSFRRSPGFRAFLIRSRAGFADPRLRSATSRFKRPFSSRNCRSSRSSLIPNPA